MILCIDPLCNNIENCFYSPMPKVVPQNTKDVKSEFIQSMHKRHCQKEFYKAMKKEEQDKLLIKAKIYNCIRN